MYDYTDAYDEAETGGPDGGPVIFTRRQAINFLKQHGHGTPAEWLVYFRESGLICANQYPATTLLEWLNY